MAFELYIFMFVMMKKIVKRFAVIAAAAILAVNFVSAAPEVGTGTDALPAGCNTGSVSNLLLKQCTNNVGSVYDVVCIPKADANSCTTETPDCE